MGVVAWLADWMLPSVLPGTGVLIQALRLATSIGAALVALGATARVLRIREFDDAFALVAQRFGRVA